MKALLLLSTLLASSVSHGLLLVCEPGETYGQSIQVLEDKTCASHRRVVLGRDVVPCAESKEVLEPGYYQMCGSYNVEKGVFTISQAADARLRSGRIR